MQIIPRKGWGSQRMSRRSIQRKIAKRRSMTTGKPDVVKSFKIKLPISVFNFWNHLVCLSPKSTTTGTQRHKSSLHAPYKLD